MSPEQQRIAIAEACGWKNFNSASHEGSIQYGQPPNAPHNSWELPDYLNDLNACHEIEKMLTAAQRITYAEQLCILWTGRDDRAVPIWFWLTEATANQRAEAFLRTLGLWQETSTPTQPQ